MKRSPMPARKTPLVSRSPLTSRVGLKRAGPLNPTSAKRRQQEGERRRVVSAMRAVTAGECARCGRRDLPVAGHERRGGSYRCTTFLRPDALLCALCNGWCEDHPQVAAFTGWKVSSKHPHDPALTPTQARRLDGAIVEFEIDTEDVA